MSKFEEIQNSVVTRKKEEVKVKVGDKELIFTANELNFSRRLSLALAENQGRDTFTMLIASSITDQDGKYMTYEQADALPDEIAQVFFSAATSVNTPDKAIIGEQEKN